MENEVKELPTTPRPLVSTRRLANVHAKRHYPVPAEQVFDAWLDADNAGKWLFATKDGEMKRVEIEPRVGGSFFIVERRQGEDVEHQGEYTELERPLRIAFDFWVSKFSDDTTRVIIDIEPRGETCELKLTHEKVWQDFANQTRMGWENILDQLAEALKY